VRSRTSRVITVSAVAALGIGVFAAGAFGATAKLNLTSPSPCCKFNKTALTAKPGTVSITLLNNDTALHNVAIKKGSKVVSNVPKAVGKGKKVIANSKGNLAKGRYTFYCSVPGHEAAGMKGTLTVK
jgi:plastocyanin